ncbi:hypothetical protein V6U80_22730, partial [Micromonospora sp. CPCC 205543]
MTEHKVPAETVDGGSVPDSAVGGSSPGRPTDRSSAETPPASDPAPSAVDAPSAGLLARARASVATVTAPPEGDARPAIPATATTYRAGASSTDTPGADAGGTDDPGGPVPQSDPARAQAVPGQRSSARASAVVPGLSRISAEEAAGAAAGAVARAGAGAATVYRSTPVNPEPPEPAQPPEPAKPPTPPTPEPEPAPEPAPHPVPPAPVPEPPA